MQALTVNIKMKDAQGRVVEEKEVATYAGVLARAHEEGLTSITTELVQVPHPDNGMVAIVTAKVVTTKGTFTGIGDANPDNVGRKIVPHLIRMAETRAKVRALRDAVNIGMVSLEELGNLNENDAVDATPAPAPTPEPRRGDVRPFPGPRNLPSNPTPRPAPAEARRPASEPAPQRAPETRPQASRPIPMTDNQRRLLYRMLSDRGFEGQQATDALLHAAEVNDLRNITKDDASMLIDTWKRDEAAGA